MERRDAEASAAAGEGWRSRARRLLSAAGLAATLAGCATAPPVVDSESALGVEGFVAEAGSTSVLGEQARFIGSPYEDVGLSGLFPVRGPQQCSVAVLQGGEDSFAVRMRTLKDAKKSIRIQALLFKGDESGLRIAEVLKQKKAEGLDVRVIVDAFSNPWLQTQWMFFDLKQHGIEVEGYEALALQWLNEIPLPELVPHAELDDPNKRFHEKMWIIDGETEYAVAVTGGLNVGNEYFRVDPSEPDAYWRDQDVVLRGRVRRAEHERAHDEQPRSPMKRPASPRTGSLLVLVLRPRPRARLCSKFRGRGTRTSTNRRLHGPNAGFPDRSGCPRGDHVVPAS